MYIVIVIHEAFIPGTSRFLFGCLSVAPTFNRTEVQNKAFGISNYFAPDAIRILSSDFFLRASKEQQSGIFNHNLQHRCFND